MSSSTPSRRDSEGCKSPTAIMEPSARMKLLVEMSHNISVDRNISIDKYFHSGRELIKSASALEKKLVHHPDYNKADKGEKKLVKEECNHVFDLAEVLKKRIMDKYEREYKEAASKQGDETMVKRSVGPQTCSPTDCDVDDIDKKFDFSAMPSSETQGQSSAFDPFNIDQLKRSFNNSES